MLLAGDGILLVELADANSIPILPEFALCCYIFSTLCPCLQLRASVSIEAATDIDYAH